MMIGGGRPELYIEYGGGASLFNVGVATDVPPCKKFSDNGVFVLFDRHAVFCL